MKQAFCPELEKAVIKYHQYNRDSHIELRKFVCDPRGDPLLLVRLKDESGKDISCLDHYWWDSLYERWEIRDVESCDRKEEKLLVEATMTQCYCDNDCVEQEEAEE